MAAIITKALSKDRAARYRNADDFLTDISAAEWIILKYLAGA